VEEKKRNAETRRRGERELSPSGSRSGTANPLAVDSGRPTHRDTVLVCGILVTPENEWKRESKGVSFKGEVDDVNAFDHG